MMIGAEQVNLVVDKDKIKYCEALLLWLYACEYWFHEGKQAECLLSIKYCVKIAARVPDHDMALALFELQGRICQSFDN